MGQSETLAHLAPFVDVSRKRIRADVEKELIELSSLDFESEVEKKKFIESKRERIEKIVEERVKDEVKRGVQTIQYQISTLMTTNGR